MGPIQMLVPNKRKGKDPLGPWGISGLKLGHHPSKMIITIKHPSVAITFLFSAYFPLAVS